MSHNLTAPKIDRATRQRTYKRLKATPDLTEFVLTPEELDEEILIYEYEQELERLQAKRGYK
ncbi:hypothetical protein [Spirosoma foliorum]|uniref:Uncharacterized protein n=1 Tax=Spirosoma foliorum TaxID=2710596 RepID=A0A7G5H5D8_9BACT|nr:hypothetical protein [Spirosoma foliorum]QMW06330.1 hypothetical protein H3H32_16290 [Spirosoma foliorum]